MFKCILPQAYDFQMIRFLQVYPQIMYSFLYFKFCTHYNHLEFVTLLINSKQCKP